jgi:hypothetical protein
MKTTTFLFALLLCVLMPSLAHGQCQIQTSASYAVFYSATVNSTGTDIISSVVVDGSATMQLQYGCPVTSMYQQFQNQLPYITHFPSVFNQIGSVGGWSSGPSACAQCYLSYQSNVDSGPLSPGQHVQLSYTGQVNCSVAGLIFIPPIFAHNLQIGKVNFILENSDASNCYYMQWCPNGNVGVSSCVADYHTFTAYGGNNPRTRCTAFHYAHEFFLVVAGYCEPVGISVLATGPINCQ